MVVLLIADIETVVLNLIATSYAAENTPINQRCMCIGIMMSLGKLLPNIAANIVAAYMTVIFIDKSSYICILIYAKCKGDKSSSINSIIAFQTELFSII